MSESRITFPCGDLQLEGLLRLPEGEAPGAAVVCHPHPLYGGSMYNNVVEAVLEAFWLRQFATLRFNFRGVGDSEGEYDGGEGELDDVREAVAFVAGKAAVKSVTLAGYSFGASVSLRAGLADPAVGGLVLVALPLALITGLSDSPNRFCWCREIVTPTRRSSLCRRSPVNWAVARDWKSSQVRITSSPAARPGSRNSSARRSRIAERPDGQGRGASRVASQIA